MIGKTVNGYFITYGNLELGYHVGIKVFQLNFDNLEVYNLLNEIGTVELIEGGMYFVLCFACKLVEQIHNSFVARHCLKVEVLTCVQVEGVEEC